MARAVGPRNRTIILFLGRCPRLVWAGPLALGFTFDRFLGRCPRLVLRGPLALILGSPPVGLEDCSLSSFGQLLHEEVGHDVVGF